MTCPRCSAEAGEGGPCFFCLATLCDHCWSAWGWCGTRIEDVQRRLRKLTISLVDMRARAQRRAVRQIAVGF